MSIITTEQDLAALCRELATQPYITVDTEFLRDKTYYPQLCLLQLAGPSTEAHAVDPLANGIKLDPLFELMADEKVVKVFHAARQDLEIFYNLTGTLPRPLFDTQVAAMVCGYGEQAGYYSLVSDICGHKLDKGAQFTDWSRRPLSAKQLHYALDDVNYLRELYIHLKAELEKRGRLDWVTEEMGILTDPETYRNDPAKAWQRIKVRTDKPRVLCILKEISAWREEEAQRRDVPRSRIVRDETLADIAVHAPHTVDELAKTRGFSADMARGRLGKGLLEAIERAGKQPNDQCPRPPRRENFPNELTPVLEMLKMLLRIQCSEHHVAPKLVASSSDLELLAQNDSADVPALKGWRFDVFGGEALALKHGKLALSCQNGKIIKTSV